MNKCQHIALLPRVPTLEDLIQRDPAAKKIVPPKVADGDHFDHPQLGGFSISYDTEFHIEWFIRKRKRKIRSLVELSERADLESERLEVGWLVGNLFSLCRIHDLERFGVPRGEQGLREYARLANWYNKKEAMWYQWAVARRKFIKKKTPQIFGDSEGRWSGVGQYRFRIEGDQLHVAWGTDQHIENDYAFLKLCNEAKLAGRRYELGTLVANIIHQASLHSLQTIPGPMEAMEQSNMLSREEASWRHWAVVPAGHMLHR